MDRFCQVFGHNLLNSAFRDTWVVQSVNFYTGLDFRVVSSSPTLDFMVGVEPV